MPTSRRASSAARVAGGALAVLCLIALALPGCAGQGRGDRVATVMVGDRLEVAAQEGWAPVAPGDAIPAGARLRTGSHPARLELRGGEVWLGPDAAARIEADRVDVIRGETLVASGGTLSARWADVEANGEAVYRLSPGVSPRLGVYSGTVVVSRPGEQRSLPALRQIGLASRRLPTDAEPLRYSPDDPWDQELLPQALAFDAEVEQLRRGLEREYGPAPQPVDFYRTFTTVSHATVPLLQATAEVSLPDALGPPKDVLVTLFVAQAVGTKTDQEPADAAAQVIGLRQAGAFWGLIASEFGITTADLARVVDIAQARRLAGGPERPPGPPADLPAGNVAAQTEALRGT